MDVTVGALAAQLDGEVLGDAELRIQAVDSLEKSDSQTLSFVGGDTKLKTLTGCDAGAIFIGSSHIEEITTELREQFTFIVVEDALDAFLAILQQERPPRATRHTGISPEALIAESATIGEGTSIHPGATIGEDASIGSGCTIHSGVVIGDGCSIGNDTTLYPRVVLYSDIELGDRVILHAGCVIGADGFGFRFREGRFEKIPQLGTVRIENDVEIGANATIDRGMIGPTVIGEGTKLDNLIMIGHNCQVGKHNVYASQVGLAGSTSTGDYVRMGGQAGIADHLHIGSGVSLAASSAVHKNIPDGATWAGYPARPAEESFRILMAQGKLPEMRTKWRALEKQVQKLTAEQGQTENEAA